MPGTRPGPQHRDQAPEEEGGRRVPGGQRHGLEGAGDCARDGAGAAGHGGRPELPRLLLLLHARARDRPGGDARGEARAARGGDPRRLAERGEAAGVLEPQLQQQAGDSGAGGGAAGRRAGVLLVHGQRRGEGVGAAAVGGERGVCRLPRRDRSIPQGAGGGSVGGTGRRSQARAARGAAGRAPRGALREAGQAPAQRGVRGGAGGGGAPRH
mmetsp:Transcript_42970/g.107542  ORF Transcript_42970/g.107542 Transcript_42970/m.107542 type:complete len:212 (-) Transcript_42970:169-804(-)